MTQANLQKLSFAGFLISIGIVEPEEVVQIIFKLGFRVAPQINTLFRLVVEEMVHNKEVNIQSRYQSLDKQNIAGDFKFVITKRFLSFAIPLVKEMILKFYFFLKSISLPDEKEYGLDYSNLKIEKVPLIISPVVNLKLERE